MGVMVEAEATQEQNLVAFYVLHPINAGGRNWLGEIWKISIPPKFLPRMPNASRENFGAPEGFDRFREEYDIRPEFRAKFLQTDRH